MVTDQAGDAEMKIEMDESSLPDSSVLVQASYSGRTATRKFQLRRVEACNPARATARAFAAVARTDVKLTSGENSSHEAHHQRPAARLHLITSCPLIENLGMKQDRVAVELNRNIVPRDQWAATKLSEGDQLEIVQFVGGGKFASPASRRLS